MNLFDEPEIKATAMTLTQLAGKYGVCARTFKKWIEPFAEKIGRRENTYKYKPEQVRKIFELIGTP